MRVRQTKRRGETWGNVDRRSRVDRRWGGGLGVISRSQYALKGPMGEASKILLRGVKDESFPQGEGNEGERNIVPGQVYA